MEVFSFAKVNHINHIICEISRNNNVPILIILGNTKTILKMVKPKKQSKRMTCRKKYKIERKVREHNRKVRKEEKLKLNKKPKSKDPGIPNLYPFKEELLRQMQEKKEQEADAKAKVKEQKQKKDQKLKQESRKRKLTDLQKDAEKRARLFEKKQDIENGRQIDSNIGVEDSKKSFYKEFKKVVEASDVVIQVLDARDPLGCRCKQLEEIILASGRSKKLVLLLNKIDLIPKEIAEKWLKYLRSEFPTVAFKASTQTQRQNLAQSKIAVNMASEDLLKSSNCLGAGTLLKLLGNYCRHNDIKTAITVGIVGFPNVGKSSVINSLKRSKACNVGSTPGVTKSMQEVQIDKHVKLLDCPGIVMATGSSDTQIILRNAVKVECLDDPAKPVEAILSRCSKTQVMEKYCVADYSNTHEFLSLFAKRLGKLKKGGVPDQLAAAKIILQDWNNGKITFYTHPPEHKTTEHDSAKVMQYLGAEFDIKALEKEEEDDLAGLTAAMGTALVLTPGKPAEMEGVEEDDEYEESGDEDEEDEDEEKEDMVDSDTENQVKDSIIEMSIKKKISRAVDDDKKGVTLTTDVSNMQLNQNKKKAFKTKQKEERKKMEKLVAAEMKALDSGDQMEKMKLNDVEDDGDDSYNFNVLMT